MGQACVSSAAPRTWLANGLAEADPDLTYSNVTSNFKEELGVIKVIVPVNCDTLNRNLAHQSGIK
jgi:hypothetical protein